MEAHLQVSRAQPCRIVDVGEDHEGVGAARADEGADAGAGADVAARQRHFR